MSNDQHDDGLVHSHGWATEPPPSVGTLLRPATDARRPAVHDVPPAMPAQGDGHDDGLVHGHDWASEHSSRSFQG